MPDDLIAYLETLDISDVAEIDSDLLSLTVRASGAELRYELVENVTDAMAIDYLQSGFQMALEFEAGLSLADNGSLVLSLWLDNVFQWIDAASAVSILITQATFLRQLVRPAATAVDDRRQREEARLRGLLTGAM